MTYLRERRLALAADLLREHDATLETVADRVGFSNAFALSAAFKREHGVSPSEYRMRETRAATCRPTRRGDGTEPRFRQSADQQRLLPETAVPRAAVEKQVREKLRPADRAGEAEGGQLRRRPGGAADRHRGTAR
jgi:hypothetical protein